MLKLWLELGVQPLRWVEEDEEVEVKRPLKRESHFHEGFSLEKAVCNHGFFMMAPNVWNPSKKILSRPFRLISDPCSSVNVFISQRRLRRYLVIGKNSSTNNMEVTFLLVRFPDIEHLDSYDRDYILEQIVRMLRLSPQDDKDLMEFKKLHPVAKQNGFGRLFRSPTLFEDVVKSILLCHCTWTRSLQMAEALCVLQLELETKTRRKSSKKIKIGNNNSLGNFPNAEELADLSERFLKERCNLGYRALHIIKLAMKITYENLNLEKMAIEETSAYSKLMQLNGFGPFVCANVLMCMGFYTQIPVDTETCRHLSDYHSIDRNVVKTSSNNIVEEIYGKYSPFQCLAYWLELVDYYEKKLGMKLSQLSHSKYGSVTGTLMGKKFVSGESTPPTKRQKK